MKFVLVTVLVFLVLVQVGAGCSWWRNRNCEWSHWSGWSVCSNRVSTRTRYHRVTQRCSGRHCTGPSRQTKTCVPVECGHGHEDGGRCICDPGWRGSSCRIGMECGPHGHESGGGCICDPGWRGRSCRIGGLGCGPHGRMSGSRCICERGWRGFYCDIEDYMYFGPE